MAVVIALLDWFDAVGLNQFFLIQAFNSAKAEHLIRPSI
jgi:hypothetical protein